MAASVDNDSEILLGNKQLLAVFAVVAFLLATAFTGGYVLGKNSAEKKAVTGTDGPGANPAPESSTALVTRSVSPNDDANSTKTESIPEKLEASSAQAQRPTARVAPVVPVVKVPVVREEENAPGKHSPDGAAPQPGQTFVQVAAMSKPEAEGMAEVLRKQKFKARIAPRPGSTTLYRVLVGPTRDASEITATRDALRKIGFRDVILQRY